MICGKARYATKGEAKEAQKFVNKHKGWELKSSYYCYDCHCWHNTSVPKEVSKVLDAKARVGFHNKLESAFKKYMK